MRRKVAPKRDRLRFCATVWTNDPGITALLREFSRRRNRERALEPFRWRMENISSLVCVALLASEPRTHSGMLTDADFRPLTRLIL
jgi:hypothetical protein